MKVQPQAIGSQAMRNIVLTTRRDFVRGCLFSAALAVTNKVVASLPLLDVFTYTMNQYTTDIALLGLEETWCRICDALLTIGMPPSGICTTRNLPKLYQLGIEMSGGGTKGHIDVDDRVSKLVVSQLRLSACDSVCCINGGICLPLVDALLASDGRKLLEGKRVLLMDSDPLAMRVCATIIAANLGFSNSDNILCNCSSDIDNICLSRFSAVLAFCTGDDDSFIRRTIGECQSAVILTSVDVNDIVYPAESRLWRGSAMTFPESRVSSGQLSLLTLDKRNKFREDAA